MLTLKGHVVMSCEENIHSNSSSRFHTASKKLQMGGHFLFWFFGYFSLRLNFDTFVVVAVIMEQNYICLDRKQKRKEFSLEEFSICNATEEHLNSILRTWLRQPGQTG